MLNEIAGINRIEKLYLQLLYRCNFNCQHCFHGEDLKKNDVFSAEQVERVIGLLTKDYGISSVTLLGGEPFLHPELPEIVDNIKSKQLRVEICTNGYGIKKKLEQIAPSIDHLRVSLEGLQGANDEIRKSGSFKAAEATIRLGLQMGIETSVTTTVNSRNIEDFRELVDYLSALGVREIKLHSLRLIGNASLHPNLAMITIDQRQEFESALLEQSKKMGMRVILDEDLDPNQHVVCVTGTKQASELERVEISPNGDIYISCKAVGSKANAFRYEKLDNRILYSPNEGDEMHRPVPQVQYSAVGA